MEKSIKLQNLDADKFCSDWNKCFKRTNANVTGSTYQPIKKKVFELVRKYDLSPDNSNPVSISMQESPIEMNGEITFESGVTCTYWY